MALRKKLSELFLQQKHSSARADLNLRRLLPGNMVSGSSNHRNLLQQRSIFQSGVCAPPASIRMSIPIGDSLFEWIRSTAMWDRNQVDALAPPQDVKRLEREMPKMAISVADARKVLRASRIAAAMARLRAIPRSYVSYSEYSEICVQAAVGSVDCAKEIASALDSSGAVIVLDDLVFLRPEQITQAIEGVITQQPQSASETKEVRREVLKEMEAKKSDIDNKAEARVKRELWAGLGLVAIQTAGFFRLTFWELSWDVMEPICFFTTSIYFMLGYAFFLRTAKEPCFEGLFASRLATKQKHLMRSQGFDLSKFEELRRASAQNHLSCCHCRSH